MRRSAVRRFGLAVMLAVLSAVVGPVRGGLAAGPVDHFGVSAPATSIAGAAFTVTVTAFDSTSSVVTGYTGTVHIVAADTQATVPADYTFTSGDQGAHSFTNGVTLRTAGPDPITVTDTSKSSISGSTTVTVDPAAPSSFRLFAPGDTTPGAALGIVDTVVLDAYGNTVVSYAGTVHFTSSDSAATLPPDYTFTGTENGQHVWYNAFVLRTVGTQTLTITDTSHSSLTGRASVVVNPLCPHLPTRDVLAGGFTGIHQPIGLLDEVAITTSLGVCLLSVASIPASSFGIPQLWSTVPFYGTRATLEADVNGDGLVDLVAVNDDSIWVMLSKGTGFAPPVEWFAGPFFGSRATLLADVTGSGHPSLIAVNDTSTWVTTSTGSSFSAPTQWSSTPFFGNRGTFAMDVVMQGKSALIAVDDSGVWVMTSTGSGFNAPTAWLKSPFYGSVATLAPTHGAEQLIAINRTGVWLTYSNGSSFSTPSLALSVPFYGNVATLPAILQGGTSVSDLLAVNTSSMWVAVNHGATYASPTEWSATFP